jgi:hypothetical protein
MITSKAPIRCFTRLGLVRALPVALRHAVESGVVHSDWVAHLARACGEGRIVVDVIVVVVAAAISVVGGNGGRCWYLPHAANKVAKYQLA